MRILGIDVGQHLGWCLIETTGDASEPFKLVTGSTIDMEVKKKTDPELFARKPVLARVVKLYREVFGLVERVKPDVIAVEHVQFAKFMLAFAAWNQNFSVIALACHNASTAPMRLISVGTIKKFATGNGRADKSEMLAALKKRFGTRVDGWDDNQIDAAWVAMCGATLNGIRAIHPSEGEDVDGDDQAPSTDRSVRPDVRGKGHNRLRPRKRG